MPRAWKRCGGRTPQRHAFPLVVLTELDDESLALAALHEGAQDYLVKGHIETRGVLRALRYAIERKSLEEALFAEKERAQVSLKSHRRRRGLHRHCGQDHVPQSRRREGNRLVLR